MNIKPIVVTGGKLCLIAAVIALLLSVTNEFTKDRIDAQLEKDTDAAVEAVIPLPGREILAVEKNESNPTIRVVTTANGDTYYAVTANPIGYGGEITMMVGLDAQYNVVGVSIISLSETPGLGSRIKEEAFLARLKGKGADMEIVKGAPTADNQVEAVTGATISSTAVKDGILSAISTIQAYAKGGAQ